MEVFGSRRTQKISTRLTASVVSTQAPPTMEVTHMRRRSMRDTDVQLPRAAGSGLSAFSPSASSMGTYLHGQRHFGTESVTGHKSTGTEHCIKRILTDTWWK